ncbi:S8 family serine peptidase [Myxococcus xanthus]|uniref:S8 family peptidase n=1 Tax=Myxococcus xanthus TaxID=34 RepID=UPI00191755F5|nr:S8 family serine peptidase [Myxococcus xanthus]QQR46130.1 S8 family serine peptidase [Myxococcus xanthus]
MRPLPEPRVDVAELSRKEVRDIGRDPELAAIAPVMPIKLVAPTSTDANGGPEDFAWGIPAVNADQSEFTGDGVTVAVLDTGIDQSHVAFKDVTLIQRDFSNSGNADDPNGHGTHCAGTILGRDVDGKRIGIARGVKKALIGRVLGPDGDGESDAIYSAIQWALSGGAKVISMSLGFDFPGFVDRLAKKDWPIPLATSRALEAYRGNLRMLDSLMALMNARAQFDGGAVVVAASGNESNSDYKISVSIPAAAQGIVSVGAVEPQVPPQEPYRVAVFSNTLPSVCAPGVSILSARAGGGLSVLSGTSMATPHVAGVATLWWEKLREEGINPTQAQHVIAQLFATARIDCLMSNVDPADRGMGVVSAPI